MKCKICDRKLSLFDQQCPNCGWRADHKKQVRIIAVMAVAAAALVAALIGIWIRSEQSDPTDPAASTVGSSVQTAAPSTSQAPTQNNTPTTKPSETTVPPTTQPKPTETEPTEPQPTETAPTEPEPTETAPTEPEPTETAPTEPEPVEVSGWLFVFDGSDPYPFWKLDVSECVVGCLYLADRNTDNVYFVTDEAVVEKTTNNEHVFFVTEAEPNRIYTVNIFKPNLKTMIYETDFGAISRLVARNFEYSDCALHFIEGNQRIVWYDYTTYTSEVLLEQYYIDSTWVEFNIVYSEDGTYEVQFTWIYFTGKLHKDDKLTSYIYNVATGEIQINNYY